MRRAQPGRQAYLQAQAAEAARLAEMAETEGAAAMAARYGPEPEPSPEPEAPPPPDGSTDPFRGRGLWGAETPGAPEPESPPAPDLASWKQQDYAQMAHAQEVAQAAPEPWWQKAWDWTVDHTGKIVKLGKSGLKAWRVRKLKFNRLEDGHISVRVETPPGTRQAYKQLVADEGFPFRGRYYNPETVAGITRRGLLRGAKSGLIFGAMVSLGQNLLNFGKGKQFGSEEYWDATVKNREFWVSTGVDFAVSVVVGVAAAAVVAGLVALAAPAFPLLAAPAVAIGLTTFVGMGIGWAADAIRLPGVDKSFPEWAKDSINRLFSAKD